MVVRLNGLSILLEQREEVMRFDFNSPIYGVRI